MPSQPTVIIVGAGPTGLTLAADLQRRGVSALTVDRLAAVEHTSRAAVVHARTLEVLEPLGLPPLLIAEGVTVPIFRVRDRDSTLLTLDFSEIESPYAFTLICPQNVIEAILLDRLRALGGDVNSPGGSNGRRAIGHRCPGHRQHARCEADARHALVDRV